MAFKEGVSKLCLQRGNNLLYTAFEKESNTFLGKKVCKDPELGFLLSTGCELLEGRPSWPGSLCIPVPSSMGLSKLRLGEEVGRRGEGVIWGKVFLITLLCMTSPIFHFPAE